MATRFGVVEKCIHMPNKPVTSPATEFVPLEMGSSVWSNSAQPPCCSCRALPLSRPRALHMLKRELVLHTRKVWNIWRKQLIRRPFIDFLAAKKYFSSKLFRVRLPLHSSFYNDAIATRNSNVKSIRIQDARDNGMRQEKRCKANVFGSTRDLHVLSDLGS